MKMNLSQAVDFYLETRRRFGFALVQVEMELRTLVRYAQAVGHTGPLTRSLILNWAQHPQQCAPSYHALRLAIGRRFAQFWLAYEPRTEIPPSGSLGPLYRRRAVHIYTPEEVGALIQAASHLGHLHPLRQWTFSAVVGLLDCTGLRISEALGLEEQDVDWSSGVLTIRHAKGGHSRLVPVQASTLEALERYRTLRNKALRSGSASRLFVSWRGAPLGYQGTREDLLPGTCLTVTLHGKGRKDRTLPLWPKTARQLRQWLQQLPAAATTPLFTNRFGARLSRFGIEKRLDQAVEKAAQVCPSLRKRRVSPHVLRHTTAMHLLQAGVDLAAIALWMGHESPLTTHQYLEADLEMKKKTLSHLRSPKTKPAVFQPKSQLLAFLEAL